MICPAITVMWPCRFIRWFWNAVVPDAFINSDIKQAGNV